MAWKQSRIEERKKAVIANYPSAWRRMISEWLRPDESDRAWLLYSANYLFRTADVRWALDPLTLHGRLTDVPPVETVRDLRYLSFIILTHSHADHLDLELVRTLSPFPILWVIPEFLLSEV